MWYDWQYARDQPRHASRERTLLTDSAEEQIEDDDLWNFKDLSDTNNKMSGRGKRVSTGGSRASPAPRKSTTTSKARAGSKGYNVKLILSAIVLAFIGVIYALDQIRVRMFRSRKMRRGRRLMTEFIGLPVLLVWTDCPYNYCFHHLSPIFISLTQPNYTRSLKHL